MSECNHDWQWDETCYQCSICKSLWFIPKTNKDGNICGYKQCTGTIAYAPEWSKEPVKRFICNKCGWVRNENELTLKKPSA